MLKKIVWFVIAVACNVCFSKQNDELDFLVPNGAFDIRKTKVEGNGLEQLTYSIKTGYPSMAVSKKDLISQKKAGWKVCDEDQDERWNQYLDQQNQYVFVSTISLLKKDVFVHVLMRYVSHIGNKRLDMVVPDNDIQQVYVMRYDLRDKQVSDQMADFVSRCK